MDSAFELCKVASRKNLMKWFVKFIEALMKWLEQPPYPMPNNEPIRVVPQPPEPPKYLWDNPTNVRHSIRLICDEELLPYPEKNVLCAVIQAESGFNTKAINVNGDGSEDYGLCQYNSKWYIERMGLITKDQALNDPEFCVRLLIKRYRQGFLRDWSAYKSGAYKKFLP